MSVRAKFAVVSITRQKWNAPGSTEAQIIKLGPVTSGSEENKAFYRYTPAGSIELATVNPEAGNQSHLEELRREEEQR
jgi:hypothetical protein